MAVVATWKGYLRVVVTSRDPQRQASTTTYKYEYSGTDTIADLQGLVANVIGAQRAIINSAIPKATLSFDCVITGDAPGTSLFLANDDKLVETFLVNDGETMQLSVGAPLATDFLIEDSETVNEAYVPVQTWEGVVTTANDGAARAHLGVDEDNQTINSAVSGTRIRVRGTRRPRPA